MTRKVRITKIPHSFPELRSLLRALKDYEFCEWIVAHKNITLNLFHEELKWHCYNLAKLHLKIFVTEPKS